MSLYDVIDEISERNVTKSETGDSRIIGVMIGTVAVNYHKDMPGRVCVTIPTRDKDQNELKWARMAQPSGGDKWGHYFLPEVGDQVLLAFEGGNIEKPYVIGSVLKDSQKFLGGSADENNQIKRIVTKNGSTVSFEDNKEGEGEKDKLLIETAGRAHSLLLDNENKLIRLTDKEKNNSIEIKTEDGAMTVKAASKLTVKVGDSITITLNGESGAVKINCNELSVAASNQFKVKSDGMMKLEAAQMMTEASSMLKLASNGMTQLGGNPIKIG
ncbi:MAG: phage baseplate assembly protein V [Oscillospiraceae bacterium]|nr:phage baseplate assembly protein V [Oscillospiraceae bacterium]